MATKTVLIIGVSSFVGSNLAEFFKRYYKVVGTYYKTPVNIPGVMTMPCDVLVREEIQLALYKTRPDLTIYCAGVSSVPLCSEFPDLADAVNTAGLFNVTEYCQRYKSQICYISSCFVFGGEPKEYVEIDIPDSNTTYGKTQASAEFFIQKTSLNYIIFRCCTMYGRGIRPDLDHWFEKFQRAFRDGHSFTVDGYVRTGYLDVLYLGMVIRMCLEQNVSNRLFQVSSPDAMNRFEFAKAQARVFGESEGNVGKAKWHFPVHISPGMSEVRQEPSYCLDVSNVEGFLNIKLPTIEESLKFTQSRFHGGTKRDRSKSDSIKFI